VLLNFGSRQQKTSKTYFMSSTQHKEHYTEFNSGQSNQYREDSAMKN
jgi:hypothetical protein